MNSSPFEQGLSEIPRTELQAGFRDEILAKACVTREPTFLTKWWRSTPKPIAAAVAAAWVTIGVLQFTFPDTGLGGGAVEPEMLATESPDAAQLFVAWIERNRSLLQTL